MRYSIDSKIASSAADFESMIIQRLLRSVLEEPIMIEQKVTFR
jgi:hypothetical protein|tara:strand:- start:10690 stop:10818 length:129 start_codon:yes stop_codon:yes gene_type:complete